MVSQLPEKSSRTIAIESSVQWSRGGLPLLHQVGSTEDGITLFTTGCGLLQVLGLLDESLGRRGVESTFQDQLLGILRRDLGPDTSPVQSVSDGLDEEKH